MSSDAYQIFSAFDFSRISLSVIILVVAFVLARSCKIFSNRLSRGFPDYRLRIEQVMTTVNFILIVGSIALAIFLLFRSKEAA